MGRDSNPRYLLGTHAFQACPLDRSGTHPFYTERFPARQRSARKGGEECRRIPIVQGVRGASARKDAPGSPDRAPGCPAQPERSPVPGQKCREHLRTELEHLPGDQDHSQGEPDHFRGELVRSGGVPGQFAGVPGHAGGVPVHLRSELWRFFQP